MVNAPFIWVAEASTLRTGADAFEEAVSRHGGIVRWIDVEQEINQEYGSWTNDQTVIFRGSFEAAARCAKKSSEPLILGPLDDFECTRYYPLIGHGLLNWQYVLWPLGDLPRLWNMLPSMFGSHEAYFVRPNSGSKAFSGQLISKNNYDHFARREACYLSQMAHSDLCLVAAPRLIHAEYRLLVVSGQVVSGSQYRRGSQSEWCADVPKSARDYGQLIADSLESHHYHHYALDVAESPSGALSVVELNSLSCASWYAADPEPVVAAVHAALSAGV